MVLHFQYHYPSPAIKSIVQKIINADHALMLATKWVQDNIGLLGPHGKSLKFKDSSIHPDTYLDSSGRVTNVWLVYFPEEAVSIEPNGILVKVNQRTGECSRAVME